MSVVISVEGLCKKYRIGSQAVQADSLVGHLRDLVTAPYRNWRQFRLPTANREDNKIGLLYNALSDVSFDVMQGSVLGIIGRNGAGKSTLLKILSRITEPSSGIVRIRGRVSSLLEVGTGFHPELSGRENIFLNGTILGMSKSEIKRKFDEIVVFSGIERFLDTPIKRYSSGMKVRLAFAVAAHLEPEVLIVDEVLAVGDFEFQKKCLGKMQDMAHAGRTVVFVSHDMAAVDCLCHEAILLKKGYLFARGSSREVISVYLQESQKSLNGKYDLQETVARRSGCESVIKCVELFSNGQPTGTLTSYSPATITISFSGKMAIRNARIAIAFEDSIGRRITTLSTFFSNQGSMDLLPNSKVVCEISQLLLGPGSYFLSVSVGTKEQGLIDSIDQAGWFEVNWRNVFGVSESHSAVFGPVLSESKWLAIDPI